MGVFQNYVLFLCACMSEFNVMSVLLYVQVVCVGVVLICVLFLFGWVSFFALLCLCE